MFDLPGTPKNVVQSPYRPRPSVLDFHSRHQRFAVMVFHRRAGKTVACINDLIDKALQCKLPMPRYSYIAPYYKQAKMVAWAYLKYYTQGICSKVMESELSVELANGATIRLYGADNPDALRGTYHDGVILDEYGDMPPRLFGEVIAPALADRKGWVAFIGTPKGSNHFYDVWENSKGDPRWFRKMLKASQSGIIDADELAMLRNMPGSDEDTFQQEFECDFHVANKGSYYGAQLNDLEAKGHMGIYPYNPDYPVLTGWDIGITDDTSIWFAQRHGAEIHIIDFWTNPGYSVDEVLEELARKPYAYSPFYLPHDAKNKSFQTGKSVRELMMAQDAPSIIVPSLSIMDGIAAVRATLPTCKFDISNPNVREGLVAMKMYQREFDEKRGVFKPKPLHDWCFTGDTEVLTRNGMRPILGLDEARDEVMTLWGWKRFTNLSMKAASAQLVEVAFSDGSTVKCTPEHKFLAEKGWISAESLLPGSKIRTPWTQSPSTSEESSTGFMGSRSISLVVEGSCTATCGGTPLGQSRQATTSTTGTQTAEIINSGILSFFRPLSMALATLAAQGLDLLRGLLRQSGMLPQRAGSGIDSTLYAARAGQSGPVNPAPACGVVRSSTASLGPMGTSKNTAETTARPPTIEVASVTALSDTAPVYCITVPGAGHFTLANGAVVKNCSNPADAFRYLSLGMNPFTARSEGRRIVTEKPRGQDGNVLNLENLFAERAAKGRSTRI